MKYSGEWSFPTTGGGKKTGFNESGIQFFNDNTLLSLAREICQNSLDAREDDNHPVIVEFNSFKLKKENIMGYDIFYDIICKEIEYAKKYYINDKNPLNFYSEAKRLLENEELQCLRISDFNTTGLTGSDKVIDSKWDRLVKSEGFSDNPTTSGGSFGIGKNAAFACSKLHTVFYSTKDNTNLIASQGVAKLSSCELDDYNITQGTGYFGNIIRTEKGTNLDRMQAQLFIDPTFQNRNVSGTDIYILGFDDRNKSNEIPGDENEGWVIDIAASIIDNYFVSILDGKLEVKINNLSLTKETLPEIFNYIYTNNKNLFNQYTIHYFNILTTKKYEVHLKKFSMFEPDDVEFTISFNPEFKNRIAVIKGTGMKIFDKDRLPQISFYCGILKLQGKEVNAYFRQMENPKHDGWYPSKLKDEKEARKQYNRLFDYVKTTISELVGSTTPESMDAEGVSEYLPDELDMGSNNEKTENISDEIIEEIQVKDRTTKKIDNIYIEGDNTIENNDTGIIAEDGEYETNYGQGDSNNSDGGTGSLGQSSPGDGSVNITSERNVLITKSRCIYTAGKYEFIFKSPIDILNAKLKVEIAGEKDNYKPIIKSANAEQDSFFVSNITFKNNVINIGKVNKDQIRRIQFEINENENWALEVKLYEN